MINVLIRASVYPVPLLHGASSVKTKPPLLIKSKLRHAINPLPVVWQGYIFLNARGVSGDTRLNKSLRSCFVYEPFWLFNMIRLACPAFVRGLEGVSFVLFTTHLHTHTQKEVAVLMAVVLWSFKKCFASLPPWCCRLLPWTLQAEYIKSRRWLMRSELRSDLTGYRSELNTSTQV